MDTLFKQLAAACNYHKSRVPRRWLDGSRLALGVASFRCQRFGKGFRTASFPRTRRFRPANKFAELIRLLCAFHPSLSVERLMAFFCHILDLFRVSYLSSRKLEKEACKSSLPLFFFFLNQSLPFFLKRDYNSQHLLLLERLSILFIYFILKR